MKPWFVALRSLILFSLILGGAYPCFIMLLGQKLSPIRSHGSLLQRQGQTLGSELIAQKFTQANYFWPRPSTCDFNPISAGASQRSATSKQLKADYSARQTALGAGAPSDLLFASASCLDPHISLDAANFQRHRISQARQIPEEQLDKLIKQASDERFLGFMGKVRVNVLELNILLDQ